MSPVGTIFVPFPTKTGTNSLHPLPPPIVELVLIRGYTKVDFTVDEGKRRLNPSRDKN